MMKCYLKICLLLCLTSVSMSAVAAEYGHRRTQNGKSKEDERREQLRAEAMEDFEELDTALTEILELVALNARPEPAQVENAAALLETNKRNAQVLDDKEKAQFMLLQAWTGYFQGNAPIAFNWSTKAFKTDTENTDAWISHGIFSMLNGKPPMPKPRPKPERKRRTAGDYGYGARRDRDNEPDPMEVERTMMGMPSSSSAANGDLHFDMATLRQDMFREKFTRVEYLAADGTQIEYKPGRDTLCLLLWQTEDAAPDPNTLTGDAAAQALREQKKKEKQAVEVPEDLKIDKQRTFFKKLYEACKDNETIKFVQINTVQPANFQAFMQSLPDFTKYPYPTVVAAVEEAGARALLGTNARIPFMLIVDKTGTVIYAGPAKDFVPAFILTETTGIPIDLKDHPDIIKKQKKQYPDMMMEQMMMDPMMMEMVQQAVKSQADPNQPIDPNKIAKQVVNQLTQQSTSQGKQYRQLSLEEQMDAEKKLQAAQLHIEESRKLRGKNPKDGVEACREILKKYPDTVYEEKAIFYLRRVPDRWKKKLEITDEELGL